MARTSLRTRKVYRSTMASDKVLCDRDMASGSGSKAQTKEDELVDAFSRWLDTALAVAIKEYGDRL